MWRTTAAQLAQAQADSGLDTCLWRHPVDHVVLCGAGTSDYIGRAVCEALRLCRGISAEARPTTDFVLRPRALFPTSGTTLMVHFARSGNSPESAETLRIALDLYKNRARHWVVTCNPEGKLAQRARQSPDVCFLTVLHPGTNDKGLAMTSSYSSMVSAGLWLAEPDGFDSIAEALAAAAERVMTDDADTLADIAGKPVDRAFYLGNGALEAVAIESALKMQELTRGVVLTKPETFLAYRHGPISALRPESLVVAFFSSDPHVRRYEEDLADQLKMGVRLFVCAEATPRLRANADYLLEIPELRDVPDTHRAPAMGVVGQLLGLFRALALGINPDDPAGADGTYSRVVQGVTIHPYRE
jgi:tagatose-6-phosphate ketose/aldose isomerase